MSTNRFGTYRPRLDEPYAKDLTPKSTKYSPKVNNVYNSLKNGIGTIKPDSSKNKIIKPTSSKFSTQNGQYFHSKQANNTQKRGFYNSNKRLQVARTPTTRNQVQYQPRSKSKSPAKQTDQIIRQEIYLQPKNFRVEDRKFKIYQNEHPSLPKILNTISNFQPAKHSKNSNGNIRAYSASTNQGPVRQYNQDRVAIILNISKPEHCTDWKKAAYFGVFDGHGGIDCADFLRDNLHNFISKERNFPYKLQQSIKTGFQKCQKAFLDQSYAGKLDKSGSCGIIAFFYGKQCYVSNVGDSRAIMSMKHGKLIKQLSIDHKASQQYQQKRIIQNGGRIYQTKLSNANPNLKIFFEGQEHSFILGPHRAFPGRLSVTRTFGDIEAKYAQFGGNSRAVVCTPEIHSFVLSEEQDFLLLACDGIYDKLNNSQVIQCVWDTFNRNKGQFNTLHEFCGKAVENIMKLSFQKKTLDNITVVMVALEGLQNYFNAFQQQKSATQSYLNEQKKPKMATSKLDASFQRKYMGRSVSPSNYSSLRTKSYYRPS